MYEGDIGLYTREVRVQKLENVLGRFTERMERLHSYLDRTVIPDIQSLGGCQKDVIRTVLSYDEGPRVRDSITRYWNELSGAKNAFLRHLRYIRYHDQGELEQIQILGGALDITMITLGEFFSPLDEQGNREFRRFIELAKEGEKRFDLSTGIDGRMELVQSIKDYSKGIYERMEEILRVVGSSG